MTNLLMKALDSTFGHPQGRLGELGAQVMAKLNANIESQVLDLAQPGADEVVLVIGPGPGVGLEAAGRRSARAIGVEPSEVMRTESAKRCTDLANVEVLEGTAERTSQVDGSIDVVISVNNVHLWDNRAAAFAEFARVLRPGGRLVVSAPRMMLPISDHELVLEAQAAGFTDARAVLKRFPGPAPAAVQLVASIPA